MEEQTIDPRLSQIPDEPLSHSAREFPVCPVDDRHAKGIRGPIGGVQLDATVGAVEAASRARATHEHEGGSRRIGEEENSKGPRFRASVNAMGQ